MTLDPLGMLLRHTILAAKNGKKRKEKTHMLSFRSSSKHACTVPGLLLLYTRGVYAGGLAVGVDCKQFCFFVVLSNV